MPTNATPAAPFTPKWYDSTFWVVVLLMILFPVGVYALFKNRRLSGIGKFFVFGAVMFLWLAAGAGLAFGLIFFLKSNPKYKDQIEELSGKFSSQKTPVPPRTIELLPTPAEPKVTVTPLPALKNPPATDPSPVAVVEVPRTTPKSPAEEKPAAPPITPPGPPIPPAPLDLPPAPTPQEKAQTDAREIERAVDDIKADQKLLAEMRSRQSEEYRRAIDAFMSTNDPDFQTKILEANFKEHLQKNFGTEVYDTSKIYDFFSEKWLGDYNAHLSQVRESIRGAVAAMDNIDERVRQFEERLAQKIDDLNQRLAGAGKPVLPALFHDADRDRDREIAAMKTRFAGLSSRPITLTDIRQTIGAKAVATSRSVVPPPTQPRTPFDTERPVAVQPVVPRTPVPPSNTYQPPQIPATPSTPIPPAAGDTIGTADVIGGWLRKDGKVSWVFEDAGQMSARGGGRKSPGTWTLDNKTATLTVSMNGIQYVFNVSREKEQLILEGGVKGAPPFRFQKVSKY